MLVSFIVGLLAYLTAFVLPLEGNSALPKVGAAVNTTSGIILGHPAKSHPRVGEYLGIRYAQAASGRQRFKPPIAYRSGLTYQAADWSPACPFTPSPPLPTFPNKSENFDRIYGTFLGQGNKTFSEDCLTLNVWTKNTGQSKLKPVTVFIHGGRFATGTANTTHYHGEHVADTGDVVFVSMNYRLHVLGFSGAPGLTQNVGILDQRMALEWVRTNIEAFGGDPKRIMLYGQSVGGLSVDYHVYAWPDDPIAAGVMTISGTAQSVQPNTPELSAHYWYNLSGIVGCPTSGDAVPCMQNQTFQSLLAGLANLPFAPTKALYQPQFQETVDEVVVFSDYAARGKAGQFAKIPYLVGNADNEAGFYKLAAFATKRNLTESQFNDFNLQGFTCATSIEAFNRVAAGVTTYRYRYFGDWENLRLYPGSGAYHGVDLNMWHGVGQDVSGQVNSEAENATSAYMMKALAAFASDPENGLQNLGWPKYGIVNERSTWLERACHKWKLVPSQFSFSENTLIRLGWNNETVASFTFPEDYDSPCAAFEGNTSLAQGAM